MYMERDKWINGILNSAGSIQKVAVPDSILDAVQYRIREERMSVKKLWLAAASVVLLAGLNLIALKAVAGTEPLQGVSQEFGFYKTHQLY